MSRDRSPLDDRDPRSLTDREFRLLVDYRLQQLEERVAGMLRALWTVGGGVLVGVIVFIVVGRPTTAKAAIQVIGGLLT